MLQIAMKYSTKALAVFMFMLISVVLQAQNKVEIDTQEVKSWLERNWIWVAAGVVLLLLIALFSRRSRAGRTTTVSGGERKTTTVIKDAQGNVQSVTTTEEKL
ncbi:MAG TPA: hypothetical protein VJU78_00010 [Chitinophagaceae bacterium]|nr:hypothetical protein [Chitinophagaceae bacterium]